jgi:hypothetical protein
MGLSFISHTTFSFILSFFTSPPLLIDPSTVQSFFSFSSIATRSPLLSTRSPFPSTPFPLHFPSTPLICLFFYCQSFFSFFYPSRLSFYFSSSPFPSSPPSCLLPPPFTCVTSSSPFPSTPLYLSYFLCALLPLPRSSPICVQWSGFPYITRTYMLPWKK